MFSKLTLTIVLSLMTHLLLAQSTFQKTIGGVGEEYSYDILEVPDGFMIVGYTTTGGGNQDGYVVKIDHQGNIIWEKKYGDTNAFTQITKANNGGYILLGDFINTAGGGYDVIIMKISENGETQWAKTFGRGDNDRAPVYGTIIKLNDGYIISGLEYSTWGGNHAGSVLIRIDNDGNEIWNINHVAYEYNIINANFVQDNLIYFSGTLDREATFGTINLSDGLINSITTYVSGPTEALYNLNETSDDNFILSDHTWGSNNLGNSQYWVLKISKSGTPIWSKTISVSGVNVRGRATVHFNGGYILTPMSLDLNPAADAILAKMDDNGNLEWARSYGGSDHDLFFKAIPVSTGGIIAIGRMYLSNGNSQILVVKTDDFGNVENCCVKVPQLNIIDFTPSIGTATLSPYSPYNLQDISFDVNNVTSTVTDFCGSGDAPAIQSAITSPNCANPQSGMINLTPIPGYTYSINDSPFTTNTNYQGLSEGTYIIRYKNGASCNGTDTITLNLLPVDLINSITTTLDPCAGVGDVTVIGNLPELEYRMNNGTWTNSPTFNDILPGNYLFSVRNSTGCKDSMSYNLSTPALLTASATTQNISCGSPTGLIQVNTLNGNGSNFLYQLNNEPKQTSSTFIIETVGTYKVTVTDEAGCTFELPNLVISTSLDSTLIYRTLDLCNTNPLKLQDGSSTSTPGTYIYQYRDKNGCDSIEIVQLTISQETLYIPNVFSPNGDGKNDYFTFYADETCIKSIKYLRVFDRWGNLHFERYNFQPNVDELGWNGKLNGDKTNNPGVFVFDSVLLFYDETQLKKTGDITTVR
jgi:gliding motility-associated-like protein